MSAPAIRVTDRMLLAAGVNGVIQGLNLSGVEVTEGRRAELEEQAARAWMREHMDDHTDPKTRIASLTTLAEGAADFVGHGLDWCDDADHPVWEWAADEAEKAGRGDHP